MTATVTIRHAARVLLIDSRDRLLLFRCRDPRIETPVLWITPGGGLHEGETHAEAAARELWEETGITGLPMGEPVWTRSHIFPYVERMLDQREQIYLVRCGDTPLIDRSQHCPIELEVLEDHHWWMADEIIDAAGEVFTPRRLGYFFKQLLEDGPPATPIDVGI